MIVVGSHGRSGLERFMMGSVSQQVVNHASCSVLLVRSPKGVAREPVTSESQAHA